MVAYMLCCRNVAKYLDLLYILRDEKLIYDLDYNKLCVYFNQIEIKNISDSCMEKLIIPRYRYLKEVTATVDVDAGSIEYGEVTVSTDTQGLLKKIKNSQTVMITRGFIYYPNKRAVWIADKGYFSSVRLLETYPDCKKYYDMLKKLSSKL